jgi:hypothetical protein
MVIKQTDSEHKVRLNANTILTSAPMSTNQPPRIFPAKYPIPREETNHPTVSTSILHLFASSKTIGPKPPITKLAIQNKNIREFVYPIEKKHPDIVKK